MSAAPTSQAAPSRFVWYELHTPDASKAQTFYAGVLGWKAQDSGMESRRYTIVHVDDVPIGGLLEKPKETFLHDRAAWTGYIGVNDVASYTNRLRKAGGSVHREVEQIPGVGSFSVVADPQGAMFVLFQPPDARQQAPRPTPGATGSPAWHDLAAADAESAFAFYANLFGWSKLDAIDMGPAGAYQMFAVGSEPTGGMMNRPDPSQPPGWLFYFNVESIHAAIDRVKSHGGRIVHGPSEVPGGQQIAHCFDTQGAIFGIVGPPLEAAK